MKKFSLMTIPVLCAAAAPLCADNMGNNNGNQKNKQQQYMNDMNKVTPSAEPAVNRWCDPFITVDFTWWKAQQDGMDYAYNGDTTSSTVSASRGDFFHPNFKYKPGFKVGFGLKFRHDGWDLYSEYTYFRNTNSKGSTPTSTAASQVNSNYLTPVGGFPETYEVDAGSSASTSWNLKFNALDLALGRDFWISKWLTLRPHFGMKFSWIDQTWNNSFGSSALLGAGSLATSNKITQFGVGMRAGLDAQYYMHKYWSIFGKFAVSALWNDFDTKRTDNITAPTFTSWNVKRAVHRVTEVLELSLGLRFEYPFHDDDFMWFLSAGWEEQIWFSQNQFVQATTSDRNDLTFQGLTVATGFYF